MLLCHVPSHGKAAGLLSAHILHSKVTQIKEQKVMYVVRIKLSIWTHKVFPYLLKPDLGLGMHPCCDMLLQQQILTHLLIAGSLLQPL